MVSHTLQAEFITLARLMLDGSASTTVQCHQRRKLSGPVKVSLFPDLLSPSYVYHSVWSVITADNFTSVKRDESFSAMFTEPQRSSASSLVMK